jgi:transposase
MKKKERAAVREAGIKELEAILDRARGALSPGDCEKLKAVVETLAILTLELEKKGASIQRLRNLLFGASTEKTSRVTGAAASRPAGTEKGGDGGKTGGSEAKRPGHGRNGVAAYPGAEKVKVAHSSLGHGQSCPRCGRGKVYVQGEPAALLRITGMAPLQATVYELERLRCNLCGEVFTADAPAGVGRAKYDETAAAMIGLLKYGSGLPFNRLEKLEQGLGVPLPAATQWEVVRKAAQRLEPVYAGLVRQAAQGEVVHNDDTAMKILDLEKPAELEAQRAAKQRTGIFTSGVVSTSGQQRQLALFFTGRKHAGENLEQVLARRAGELAPPIQMCDALSRNTTGEFETLLAHCLAHARRQFVEVAASFPEPCRYVLETLRDVYRNDAIARERQLSPQDRLAFHQEHSGPLMGQLQQWLQEQIAGRRVEPNSGLGEAITYMLKHWPKLTLFLHRPGAPLDNNVCERALKKAILHRKNSLFYKSENGARVGDLFMSLIHTAELANADPFDYLVALQRHHREAAQDPAQWMPWNYQESQLRLRDPPAPPA